MKKQLLILTGLLLVSLTAWLFLKGISGETKYPVNSKNINSRAETTRVTENFSNEKVENDLVSEVAEQEFDLNCGGFSELYHQLEVVKILEDEFELTDEQLQARFYDHSIPTNKRLLSLDFEYDNNDSGTKMINELERIAQSGLYSKAADYILLNKCSENPTICTADTIASVMERQKNDGTYNLQLAGKAFSDGRTAEGEEHLRDFLQASYRSNWFGHVIGLVDDTLTDEGIEESSIILLHAIGIAAMHTPRQKPFSDYCASGGADRALCRSVAEVVISDSSSDLERIVWSSIKSRLESNLGSAEQSKHKIYTPNVFKQFGGHSSDKWLMADNKLAKEYIQLLKNYGETDAREHLYTRLEEVTADPNYDPCDS